MIEGSIYWAIGILTQKRFLALPRLLVVVGTRPLYEGLSVSWCGQAVTELPRLAKK